MAIEKKCTNCAKENGCPECDCNKGNNYEEFAPKEELVRQDERNKFITLLKSDLETLDLSVYDNSKVDENYAVKDYIESTIELLEKGE